MNLHGKTFRVGGIDYTVEIVPDYHTKDGYYGRVFYATAEIKISDKMQRDRTNETLVHELVHAMLFEAGYDDHEEEFVRRFATVLHQVLRDNDFSFMRGEADE
jgi:hypothetical protein